MWQFFKTPIILSKNSVFLVWKILQNFIILVLFYFVFLLITYLLNGNSIWFSAKFWAQFLTINCFNFAYLYLYWFTPYILKSFITLGKNNKHLNLINSYWLGMNSGGYERQISLRSDMSIVICGKNFLIKRMRLLQTFYYVSSHLTLNDVFVVFSTFDFA